MTVVADRTYSPGQAAWIYFTFTNPDAITEPNPYGLVDADPVNVNVVDPTGEITTGVATHLSLGYYRYMVMFEVGGGSYLIHPQGSGLGYANEEVVVFVGRSPF